MTYQNMTNEELCTRLTAKYRNRVDAACTNAKNITEDISRKKAQATAENRRRSGMARDARSNAVKQIPGFTSAKKAAREPSFENFVSDGNYGYAFARAQRVRSWAAMSAQRDIGAQSRRRPSYDRAYREDAAIEKKTHTAKARLSLVDMWHAFTEKDENETGEKRVKTLPVSKSLIVSVILCTVMLMTVLFTYSSYAQLNARVDELKAEKQTLMAEREHLEGLLAVRDDIREIEDYATNVIGMVKSDYVETKYVSIADGERIEVISADNGEGETEGLFSTLLSAMGGNWERVLEYID
ncbi:MAG: hypothetical protein E7660_01945 [Ruminococcaceae bacterium]|nr:hypothetical protein [Oscillospiraceae bacterium]